METVLSALRLLPQGEETRVSSGTVSPSQYVRSDPPLHLAGTLSNQETKEGCQIRPAMFRHVT